MESATDLAKIIKDLTTEVKQIKELRKRRSYLHSFLDGFLTALGKMLGYILVFVLIAWYLISINFASKVDSFFNDMINQAVKTQNGQLNKINE